MITTDEQVAALRALLVDDFEQHERLIEVLREADSFDGYTTLMTTAFFEAVERRFGSRYRLPEVIMFVATARAGYDETGTDIDPRAAERVVLAALGEGSVDDLEPRTRAVLVTVLLATLIASEGPDDARLDEYLGSARALADTMMSR